MEKNFKHFLKQFTYPINVEAVLLSKNNSTLYLTFGIEYSLPLNEYKTFIKTLGEFLLNDHLKKLDVRVKYLENNLSNLEMVEYFKYVIEELRGRYLSFNSFGIEYSQEIFTVSVDSDSSHLEAYTNEIEIALQKYGFSVKVLVVVSTLLKNTLEIISEQAKNHEIQLMQQRPVVEEVKDFKIGKFKFSKNINEPPVSIKEIPMTQYDLERYEETKGYPVFIIEGEIFDIEIKKLTNFHLATIKVTDQTDSIIIKRFLKKEDEVKEFSKFKSGDVVKVSGKVQYDSYLRDITMMADAINYFGPKMKKEILDTALEKRVELHCHTKMSNMDGISDAVDFINQANKWSHKAIAFTDHAGVYAIPDINKAVKGLNIKPIYGIECSFVDEDAFKITSSNEDIILKDATYVVFDIETTGFSATNDAIIEIAAHKVHQGQTIATLEKFVNPKRKLSAFTTELTSITDADVENAPPIEVIMPEFIEFCQGAVMVAHNASFDMSHIYANCKKLGIEANFPSIDTLQLARAFYSYEGGLKRFNLKAVSKFFKVKQQKHHRASDDTRVTVEIFLNMLNDLYKKGINNYNQINAACDMNEAWKHVIPSHINLLAKSQVGFKNLYKIVSDTLTKHFHGEARLVKSVLNQYREGILIGSGCVNGDIFQTALNKDMEELMEKMKYFDYIEVQPPRAYLHLITTLHDGLNVIQDTIKKIINTAKQMNKIVVATSDCHYIDASEKKYRDIYIQTPQVGGGLHNLASYEVTPDLHFRTTQGMLEEFSFIEPNLAYEIVVTNTNVIADMIEKIEVFPKNLFTPKDDSFKDSLGVDSIVETLKKMVTDKTHFLYGDKLPQIIEDRMNKELNSIINNGFSSIYYLSHLIVKKSLDDDYLVGSRGSVGSSFVATMMDITEVNPMPPHYRCPKCKFSSFKLNDELKEKYGITEIEACLQEELNKVETGFDLEDAVCPVCQEKLVKDGHDIPFETFLGFDGDKVPDIDLNFSGEYQPTVHEYIRSIMGEDNAFRSGTIATVAEKNAFGYVKGYLEKQNKVMRSVEIERIAKKIEGAKRSTGQHPGGIIVVPNYVEIYDITPIQYPADDTTNSWRTTHFDYHSFENNLLKLDILGHDDPTLIKFLMDYVKKHPDDFPFKKPQDIPIDDKKIYQLFSGTSIIGVTKDDILSEVASYAVPEFGTNFTRQMLVDTKPKTFGELVKISGLSHGTDVWLNNAQSLVLGKTDYGKIDFSEVIGCRDDIMVYLVYQGLEPLKAFKIMEFVRKGLPSKKKEEWEEHKEYMRKMNVPEWYIWSCEQIKYMFPKAHATAYVLMALRIAWFKVYKPILFYSAFFSKRAVQFEVEVLVDGVHAIRNRIMELQNKQDITNKEEELITTFSVALEMTARGMSFKTIDIHLSGAVDFIVESDTTLRIPFSAIDGLGKSVALDVVEQRNVRPFDSKEDLQNRTKINKTVLEKLESLKSLGDLPDKEPLKDIGLFALD